MVTMIVTQPDISQIVTKFVILYVNIFDRISYYHILFESFQFECIINSIQIIALI